MVVKLIYSEKATKFCEIFTLILNGTTKDKSKVKISQNFEAFSEYINFNSKRSRLTWLQAYTLKHILTWRTKKLPVGSELPGGQ